jgi:outer membrane receptor protein involved in Fe transport
VPVLLALNGVSLPSSRRQFEEWVNNNVAQLSNQFSLRRGRSSGIAGLKYRRAFSNSRVAGINSSEAIGATALLPDGFYLFRDLGAFAAGQPQSFSLSVERAPPGPLRPAQLERYYRSTDWAAFVQNDWRLHRRLSLNVGLRYEYFGVPHNRDRARDVNFYFGLTPTGSPRWLMTAANPSAMLASRSGRLARLAPPQPTSVPASCARCETSAATAPTPTIWPSSSCALPGTSHERPPA